MTPRPSKILDRKALQAQVARWRGEGERIILANGAFDVLHVGHVRYLQASARQADVLIVGVNADESARALKGEGRPLVPEQERAEMISAVRGVSYVTIFRDNSPARLLAILKPDVHCKGTDYTPETVPEREIVLGYGGRIAIVGDAKEHSTSSMIERMKAEG